MSGRVAGGAGGDLVKIINCENLLVTDLTNAEVEDGAIDAADIFKFSGAIGCDVYGGEGNDIFRMGGVMDHTRLTGGAGADTFNGGRSDFENGWIEGYGGDPWFDSGDGKTTVTPAVGWWGDATINGGPADDTLDLRGTQGSVAFFGGYGKDDIYGGYGNDFLDGGPGEDTLKGGWGGDTLYARDGERDFLSGGEDYDVAYIDPDDANGDAVDVFLEQDVEAFPPDYVP
jgi:Ca2+-binding RTX toxin-like protein